MSAILNYGNWSIAIGAGQTVVEPYHLRLGPDPEQWIDIDLRSGKAITSYPMTDGEIGDVCLSAIKLAFPGLGKKP